jgi:hypothetical protein
MGSTNSCLLLCDSLAHCAQKFCARQLECLCIPSEIVAKLFDFLRAMLFAACEVEKCVALCEARIKAQSVNSELKNGELR